MAGEEITTGTITDFSTDIAKVRALIPDTEQVVWEDGADPEFLFSDAHIQAFLDTAGGSVLRAAGFAVMAVAGSEALISKIIKTQDLATDGASLATSLRLLGRDYISQADKIDANDVFDYFELIDFHEGWDSDGRELTERPWYY